MIENSKLFKRLRELEERKFKNSPISSNIIGELIPFATNMLNRIFQYLGEYTLHDIEHSNRIIEIIEKILPENIKLNIIEIKILFYAVFLHDIGMICQEKEEEEIKKSEEFKTLKSEKPNEDETKLISEYIRKYHVKRSVKFIDKIEELESNINFEYKNIDLKDYIKNVIEAHGLTFKELKDENKYPTEEIIADEIVNIQFLSILLRLGDLLDADVSRTPKYLKNYLDFQSRVSESKWEKSLALRGKSINFYSVKFNFKCESPKIERDVRKYLSFVENQIEESVKLLKCSKYQLELSPKVEVTIRNNGSYVSANQQITLDYDHVIKILMGTELYDSPDVFLRELIQNSRDACKMMESLCKKYDREYKPEIKVEYDKEIQELKVIDNGIGMNSKIVEDYLINIGKSYYKSDEFKSNKFNFYPVSNFGIGILSCFMVSDTINVKSKRYKSFNDFYNPIDVTLKFKEEYIDNQNPINSPKDGTIITLKLKDKYAKKLKEKSIYEILEDNILVFEIPIYIKENNQEKIFKKEKIEVPKEFEDYEKIEIGNEYFEGVFIFNTKGININNYLLSKFISQNGFIIDRIESLIPFFLSNFSTNFYINLKGKEKFDLKASRNKIIKNNQFNKIQNIVADSLIEKANNLFFCQKDIKLLSKYLNNNFIIGDEDDFNFFLKYLSFLSEVILFKQINQKGEEKYISFKEIQEQKFTKITFIDELFFDFKIIDKKFNEIYQTDLTLTNKYFEDFFINLIAPYVKQKEVIVSKKEGVVYQKIYLDFNKNNIENFYKSEFNENNNNRNVLFNFDNKATYALNHYFMIILNMEKDLVANVVYSKNASYLSQILFKNEVIVKNNKRLKFLSDIENILYNKMYSHQLFFKYSNSFANASIRSINFVQPLTIGIIDKKTLDEINNLIETDLIPIFIKENLIKDTEEEKQKCLLTKNDFVDWWLADELRNEK